MPDPLSHELSANGHDADELSPEQCVIVDPVAADRDTAAFLASLPAGLYDVELTRSPGRSPWRPARGERLTADQRHAYGHYRQQFRILAHVPRMRRPSCGPRPRARRRREGSTRSRAPSGDSASGDPEPGELARRAEQHLEPARTSAAAQLTLRWRGRLS